MGPLKFMYCFVKNKQKGSATIMLLLLVVLLGGALSLFKDQQVHSEDLSQLQNTPTDFATVVSPSADIQPTLKIISPADGEKLVVGQSYVIKYDGYGASTRVNISLKAFDDSGRMISPVAFGADVLAGAVENTDFFNWVIPPSIFSFFTSVPVKYKIEVSSAGMSHVGGESEGFFTIGY